MVSACLPFLFGKTRSPFLSISRKVAFIANERGDVLHEYGHGSIDLPP